MTTTTSSTSNRTRARSVWRAGGIGGLVAAVVTTVLAATAHSQGVPLDVGSQHVRAPMFAAFTLIGAVLGSLLGLGAERRLGRPRRTFIAGTVTLAVLSVLPDVAADATRATKVVLVIAHLVAAAIIIPSIASSLAAERVVSDLELNRH